MGILLRVDQFAPLDGAKFMSPPFYRGRDVYGCIVEAASCRLFHSLRAFLPLCHFDLGEKSSPAAYLPQP